MPALRFLAVPVAAIMLVSPALAAEPAPIPGLVCMTANGGQGSAPVYGDPTSGVVTNRSMPVVLAVAGTGGMPDQQSGRVRIRTPSNHEGWVDARLLKLYSGCTPLLMHDSAGKPLLGFK